MVDSQKKSYIIGIDVGGTNTDAVLLETPSKRVVAAVKTSTTRDIQTGVSNSIKGLLERASYIANEDIKAVMLGTTAFVNAFLQLSEELSRVSVIRLC